MENPSNSNVTKESAPKSQSILKVDLKASQNFGNGVEKVVVPFKREEDMILLCLSIFLHDFVHDYNLASMHKRVIKGEVDTGKKDENGNRIKVKTYDILKTLNIGINNPTFKIYLYESGGYGEVTLYDDEKFEDIPIREGSKIKEYLKYIQVNNQELPIAMSAGEKTTYEEPLKMVDIVKENKSILEKKMGDDTYEEQPYISPEDENVLYYPLIRDFTEKVTYETLIKLFEKNADFLGMHSSLNTYVVTYLGSNIGKEAPEFLSKVSSINDKNGKEMHNLAMFNYILCSFDCISNDIKNSLELTSEDLFFSDLFIILRSAYISIFNSTNKDLTLDPLDILNSTSVLQQFIVFYMLFLNCKSIDEFLMSLNKQVGGDEMEEGEVEKKERYNVLQKLSQNVEVREYPGEEGQNIYYAKPESVSYPGTEGIFITHNNLLTTLARGMFVKLGIWEKIFSGIPGYSKTDGTFFTFGYKEMDMISYDKLIELYPTSPENEGHINNELLILQILILKNILIEMPPAKTLTLGSKIDDQLKNYLDVFYNHYFIDKNQKTEVPPVNIDAEVIENPNIPLEKETDTMFFDSDYGSGSGSDEESIEHMSDSDIFEGGGELLSKENIEGYGDIEMTEIKGQPDIKETGEEGDKISEPNVEEQSIKGDVPQIVTEIIKPPRPPTMPILFKNLKKMYQNNIYTIQNLKSSKIPQITLPNGTNIDNLYDLLSYNETLMHRTGTQYNIPSPALKFVINNAANIAANINGSKMIYSKRDKLEIKRIIDEVNSINDITEFNVELTKENETYNAILEEVLKLENREKELKNLKRRNKITLKQYNELLKLQYEIKNITNGRLIPSENKRYILEKIVTLNQKEGLGKGNEFLREWTENYAMWFDKSQALFGLYRSLVRGTFCPTTSMMDAMFNCSIKYGATETKEVGTSFYELIYESDEIDPSTNKPNKVISYGGVVLNYNEIVNDIEQLNAKIDFDLVYIDRKNQINDVANISTIGMQVAESHDLKASVVYKCIIDKIKEIYSDSYSISTDMDSPELAGIDMSNVEAREKFLTDKINRMWTNVQIYKNAGNFNKLLASTSIKTFGDYLQECLACIKWGGYVNSINKFPENIKSFVSSKDILPIYRGVSEENKIVPYDNNGNALRLGIQGDRPSGFRSIYILLNASSGINQNAITGYVYTSGNQKPSRSILVSRNSSDLEDKDFILNNLNGKVIYTTRELPVIEEEKTNFLKLLQFKTIREKKTFTDSLTGQPFLPEIKTSAIEGSSQIEEYKLEKPNASISSLEEPYKNKNYDLWDDYETPRVITGVKNKVADFIEGSPNVLNKSQKNLGLDKLAKKEETKKVKMEKEMQEYNDLLLRKNALTPEEKRRFYLLKKREFNQEAVVVGGTKKRSIIKFSKKTRKLNKKRNKKATKKNKASKKLKGTKRCKK
jgi:hypothetical protein